MKTTKDFQSKAGKTFGEDNSSTKKAVKLNPIKKSGKDRHRIFSSNDDEEDDDFLIPNKKESILDYFDDAPEDDDYDQDEDYDADEDYEDEDEDYEDEDYEDEE